MAHLIHFVDVVDVEEIVKIVEDNKDIPSYFDVDVEEVGK